MNKRVRGMVGIGLAAALLAAVLHQVDWREFGDVLLGARLGPLGAVIVVTVASYWVRAVRWGELLAPVARVGQRTLFAATMLGYAASLVVPRSGELLRPWLVSRRKDISTSTGFATIVLERLADLITVLGLFALYILIQPPAEEEPASRLMQAVTFGGGIAAAIGIGLLALLFALHRNAQSVLNMLDRLLRHAPHWVSQPVGGFLINFSGGLAVMRAPARHLVLIGVQSLVVWLLIALGFHLTQIAFSIDLPFQTTFLLIVFLVVGEAIPTPGLVGGFHAFYVLALGQVYGIDHTTAVAAAIAAHALTTLPVLVLGSIYSARRVAAWRD